MKLLLRNLTKYHRFFKWKTTEHWRKKCKKNLNKWSIIFDWVERHNVVEVSFFSTWSVDSMKPQSKSQWAVLETSKIYSKIDVDMQKKQE